MPSSESSRTILGGREVGREGEREGGRKGGRERGREGGRGTDSYIYQVLLFPQITTPHGASYAVCVPTLQVRAAHDC